MALATIRVIMPIGLPKETGELCTKIIAKHTALGVDSPLTGFLDMAIFGTRATNAINLQNSGDTNQALAQSKYNQLQVLCGIADGQNKTTPNTIYTTVLDVRDFLKPKYRIDMEQLSEWGYNVVISSTGGHTYVRIDIPNDTPAHLLGLAGAISQHHVDLGVASPIPAAEIDMAAFATQITDGNTLLGAFTSASALAQSKHNQALVIFGYGNGQTSLTPETLYSDLCLIRDRLKFSYKGAEEQMTEWSFNVILGSHKPGKKKGKTILAILEGIVAPSAISSPDIQGIDVQPTDTATFEVTAPLRIYASATAGEAPGAATLFIDILPGASLVKTIAQLITELGIGDLKPFLNIQNIGILPAQYKITFRLT